MSPYEMETRRRRENRSEIPPFLETKRSNFFDSKNGSPKPGNVKENPTYVLGNRVRSSRSKLKSAGKNNVESEGSFSIVKPSYPSTKLPMIVNRQPNRSNILVKNSTRGTSASRKYDSLNKTYAEGDNNEIGEEETALPVHENNENNKLHVNNQSEDYSTANVITNQTAIPVTKKEEKLGTIKTNTNLLAPRQYKGNSLGQPRFLNKHNVGLNGNSSKPWERSRINNNNQNANN